MLAPELISSPDVTADPQVNFTQGQGYLARQPYLSLQAAPATDPDLFRLTAVHRRPRRCATSFASLDVVYVLRDVAEKLRGVRFTRRRGEATWCGCPYFRIRLQYIIKAVSMFDRMYYVDLKNPPSDPPPDDAIYDVFKMMGLTPLITPTFQAGALTSRDHTVWFNTAGCTSQLMVSCTIALPEIFFDGFDRPMCVQHTLRALNTLPPSLAARQNQRASALPNASGPTDTEGGPAGDSMTDVAAPPPRRTGSGEFGRYGHLVTTQRPHHGWAKPRIGASFPEWVKVSSRISILTPKARQTGTIHQVSYAPGPDGWMIFGIPCTPTHYEIGFNDPDDEDDDEDTDVNVFVEGDIVSTTPLIPSPAMGKLILTHTLLYLPRNNIPRKYLRKMAAATHGAFATLTDPEARLAAISAQPRAHQSVVNECDPAPVLTVADTLSYKHTGGLLQPPTAWKQASFLV
ncbi:hypothetical protein PF011_g21591 [Phytophthora fragariae]|uniref:Uncharacterized protein n=2 Tax=Phytophthora fragariae TaxID=53985 RepID=A0A6A3ISS0_9STRA|nr:hypothetical protein PF011_g21591 [Phytophthora fragariae]